MKTVHKIKFLILAVLFLTAILSVYIIWREDRGNILTVAFLDVGQGDAIYIEAPNGSQMLIDGGPGKAVLRELGKVMPFYDRSINVVVATHADQDHVGGLPDVIDKYDVNFFVESGMGGESLAYKELETRIKKREAQAKTKKILAKRGMLIDLGMGAVLQILFPDRDPSGMDTNTASIVARLVYGENEFLFTGDSPKAIEDYLVSLEEKNCPISTSTNCLSLKSNVLKAGHHGSKTSNSQEYVAAVSPEYAIISAGKDNKYGHPNQEVLDILNNFGAKILRTDEIGRIVLKSDGVNLKIY